MMLAAPPAWMPLVLGGVAAAGLGLHRGRTWGLVALAALAAALALHASGLFAPVGVTWHVAGSPNGALQPPEGADELVAWRAALFAGSAALACALAVAPYAGPAWRWLRGRA